MLKMVKLNDEEIALIQQFRLLTSRQRAMLLSGVFGVCSKIARPLAPVVPLPPRPAAAAAAAAADTAQN
jgi:hypothetical protein